jgi:surface antigen
MNERGSKLPFDADALLDGALPPAAAAAAVLRVRDDEAVAAGFGRHAAAAALSHIVLATRLADGGSRALPADARSSRRQVRAQAGGRAAPHGERNWWRLAAAAGLLLAVGLGAGAIGAAWRTEQVLKLALAQDRRERQALQVTIEQALEHKQSGEAVAWHSRDGARQAEVVPLRTYRSASGHWCREYRIDGGAPLPAPSMRGVACRDDAGQWRTVESHI